MPDPSPVVQGVLWDADGVLQHTRRPWKQLLDEMVAPGFAAALFEAEKKPLRGQGSMRECVSSLLAQWDSSLSVQEVLACWQDLDVDAQAFALVDAVRAAGTPCHLATNQQDHRVVHMRADLGYDAHFDQVFYSSELGAMKPDAEYFEKVLKQLGEPARTLVFIDDNAANIATASALGLRAHQHDPAAGVTGLRAILSAEGVPTGPA
ncbi:HAD family hydrolase [Dermacoccaceae bacterium W4C1]